MARHNPSEMHIFQSIAWESIMLMSPNRDLARCQLWPNPTCKIWFSAHALMVQIFRVHLSYLFYRQTLNGLPSPLGHALKDGMGWCEMDKWKNGVRHFLVRTIEGWRFLLNHRQDLAACQNTAGPPLSSWQDHYNTRLPSFHNQRQYQHAQDIIIVGL